MSDQELPPLASKGRSHTILYTSPMLTNIDQTTPYYPLITRQFDLEKVDPLDFPWWREIIADDTFICMYRFHV